MNAQLAGKGDTRIGATTIGTGIRRIMTLSILVSATIITSSTELIKTTEESHRYGLRSQCWFSWRQPFSLTGESWAHL